MSQTDAGTEPDRLRQEIRAEIQASGAETRRHVDSVETRILQRVDAAASQTRRHFDVVAESLRSDIRAVAEGLGALDEKVERFRVEVRDDLRKVDQRLLRLEAKVSTLERR
jgi:hypothetical protein